jgi:tetrahydromethanopterin S-methyltransferase subunit H
MYIYISVPNKSESPELAILTESWLSGAFSIKFNLSLKKVRGNLEDYTTQEELNTLLRDFTQL